VGEGIVEGGCAQHLALLTGLADAPLDGLVGPLDGVVEVLGDGVWLSGMGLSPVVGCGVALAKEIALDLVWLGSQPFPVDLIEIVRLEDETADNAGTWTLLHDRGDGTKHDVLVRLDGGRLELLGDDEVGSSIVINGGSFQRKPICTLFAEVGDLNTS